MSYLIIVFDIFRTLPESFFDVSVDTMINFLKSFNMSDLDMTKVGMSAMAKEMFLVRTWCSFKGSFVRKHLH